MSVTPDMPAAWDGGSLPLPYVPQKALTLEGLGVTHRSRFAVAATAEASRQARTVAGTVLPLMLPATETSAVVTRQVQACVTELAGIAYTRAMGSHVLCELWRDSEHVFTAVQHHEPLPLLPDDTVIGLHTVRSLADDYGSHLVDGVFQMWAAVRIA